MGAHFFTFILLGLSIALPVGAVTIEMVKQGLKNGFLHGWCVGLGGMTVDFIFILLLYFGFAPLLSLSVVQTIMWFAGCVFLVYIGCESVKDAGKDINLGNEQPTKSLKSSYLNGFFVAVSPGSVMFWMGIFGTILSNSMHVYGISGFLFASAGILTGITLHDITLMAVISKTRTLLNKKIIKWVSVTAGCLLFGFAAYFMFEFFKSIFKIMG
ncbi:amino acid transporter [Weizmannia acidilactici]|uniref:Amino acid transporter n=1 Tax=Weizmannia acidilactici TaxID=2607726 RepID=A0A5J4JMN6_9BACI|nr:LysE family transporter [Weizmannia acidilactici]GER66535.1 amino acid transporter [Weizmannia acidilactici]GER70244.1 amino acid transporter [Weizmannia acidilactici]GER74555.1 amino acid transporter [Weizmannia acidilactici]